MKITIIQIIIGKFFDFINRAFNIRLVLGGFGSFGGKLNPRAQEEESAIGLFKIGIVGSNNMHYVGKVFSFMIFGKVI